MLIGGGTSGVKLLDSSAGDLLVMEETQSTASCETFRVQYTSSATGTVTMAVQNEASNGYARLYLSSTPAQTGNAELQVLPTGGFQVNAPSQTIALNNHPSGGQAALVVNSDGTVTTHYGFTNLSDARVKTNLRDLPPQAVEDLLQVRPYLYNRIDCELEDQVGFVAQDLEASGALGKVFVREGALKSVDYGGLVCVLWEECRRLRERLDRLEKHG